MTKKINLELLSKAARTIRCLAMDGVQKAASGHPGLPLGLAELGACIYGEILSHFPKDPSWPNRDRFVLSAGHGSMLLYSLLFLSGYDVTMDDLKNFRQLGSKTPGHPEYGRTPGVETSTGPLGQGVSNAVGMAIAERMLSSVFNTNEHSVIDHCTYALASDGDMMEGIASEAASIAGHLGLGKLILFYDSNKITIDGSTSLSFSEDVGKRFEGYNWHVEKTSAYDMARIVELTEKAKAETRRPSLIIVESVMAKGSAHMEGSNKAHGAPLGEDEIKATKKALGIPEDAQFYVDPDAAKYFESKNKEHEAVYKAWNDTFNAWGKKNPLLLAKWNEYFNMAIPSNIEYPIYPAGEKLATRVTGGKILNAIAKGMPNLVGGSADLASSNNTLLAGLGEFGKDHPEARNIFFGIREHAMAGICNGIALHGGLRPFCSTFLIFSDYMKPSIRLACLMKLPVIYVFTHDSIFVGEDGPTHQPIEQLTALRIIPGMTVLRPADAEESVLAWQMALDKKDGPTALALTRQNLEVFPKKDPAWKDKARRGAYVAEESEGTPEIVVVASGSEVSLAIKAKALAKNPRVRIVSMISLNSYRDQDDSFKESIIPRTSKKIFIEAGITDGWGKIGSASDIFIGLDDFGESGPGAKVAEHFGLTEAKLAEAIALAGKTK
jgi:transketolase